MKPYLFIVIASGLLLGSCKKETQENNDPTLRIPQIFHNYVFFEPGSYWVYKDTVSGNLDTLIVISTKSNKLFADDSIPVESYQMSLTSSFHSQLPIMVWCEVYPLQNLQKVNWYKGVRVLSPSQAENNIIFLDKVPAKLNWGTLYVNSTVYMVNGVATTVQGITYNNTLKVIDSAASVISITPPPFQTLETEQKHVQHTYEKGIGLIKKEIFGDVTQVWELIDYKIAE